MFQYFQQPSSMQNFPRKRETYLPKKAQQMHDENHHCSGAKRDDYGIGVCSSADVFNEAMMFMEPSGASHCHLLIV